MKSSLPKFATSLEVSRLLLENDQEFAVVRNPGYIYAPYDLYPLAPKRQSLPRGMAASVMDMDGTTTTTETLCIHSLETMVKRISRITSDPHWGLEPARDYPHIIGNSTTKHVEYLIQTYWDRIDSQALREQYLRAALWTLSSSPDPGRKEEVSANLRAFGIEERPAALEAMAHDPVSQENAAGLVEKLRISGENAVVRAGIDIYYQRYHEILGLIESGQGREVAKVFSEETGGDPICPMPGIGVYLALVTGLLGKEAEGLWEELAAFLQTPRDRLLDPQGLAELGQAFQEKHASIALVTSSIAYEAGVVLGEVFRLIRRSVRDWPVSEACRERIEHAFSDHRSFYRAVITASDSSEIRLKPHRDLYSLALHRVGLEPGDFDRVVGFEDSESGTIAIRAAGIPLCVAVPFHDTQGHSFEAASVVAHGGLPEVILEKACFLAETL
jgi:beta-phosphoglucomutase-like phosphatase (HAD superfamily)